MVRIAILLSAYNRKDKTLACLESCQAQIESMKPDRNHEFSIYLTEDACTDGTPEAVSERFPSVHIIHGTGHLFWNRGMCAAWSMAAEEDPDFYLWINDDIVLKDGAFAVMLEISAALGNKAVVVGTAEGSHGELTYGGRTRKGRIIPPDATIPVGCDIFNGNLVLVPRYVYRRLGTMDPVYSHGFGDYDYGVRAWKAGIDSVIAPGILAVCDRNRGLPQWRDASYSLKERYRFLMQPKGRPFREQFIYDLRSEGCIRAVAHFITLNLRVLFPLRRQG